MKQILLIIEQRNKQNLYRIIYNTISSITAQTNIMNRANRYRKSNTTYNNLNDHLSQKDRVDQNQIEFAPLTQNSFHHTHQQSDVLSRFSAMGKRVRTEPSEIQPFRDISNLNLNGERMKSFIKTKNTKLNPKSNSSNRENQHSLNSIKHSKKFQSNFQILKKQIEELQSLQILRAQSNQSHFQRIENIESQPNDSKINTYESFYPRMTTNGEFASGKSVSILQKKRQNIKKVIKNKKFRNYINPHNNINDFFCKNMKQATQYHQERKKIVSFISLSKDSQSQSDTNLKIEWRKKQTPQIIKKYYRPKSCILKKQIPSNKQIKLKNELSNYISLNSFTLSQKKNDLSNIQVPSSLRLQTSKNQRSLRKQFVVLCL